jgi:hypothetical protein
LILLLGLFVVEKNPSLTRFLTNDRFNTAARHTSEIGLLHLAGEALGYPGCDVNYVIVYMPRAL